MRLISLTTKFVHRGSEYSNYLIERHIFHEIGHILGIGNIFKDGEEKCCSCDDKNTNCLYTCDNAKREYQDLYPTDQLRMTANCAHFDTVNNFGGRDEIMGASFKYYNECDQIEIPISRVTVGAMADRGYEVNYAEADDWPKDPIISTSRTIEITKASTIEEGLQEPLLEMFGARNTEQFETNKCVNVLKTSQASLSSSSHINMT
jgi:hypothetical protein